jgi:hypothetical protein
VQCIAVDLDSHHSHTPQRHRAATWAQWWWAPTTKEDGAKSQLTVITAKFVGVTPQRTWCTVYTLTCLALPAYVYHSTCMHNLPLHSRQTSRQALLVCHISPDPQTTNISAKAALLQAGIQPVLLAPARWHGKKDADNAIKSLKQCKSVG